MVTLQWDSASKRISVATHDTLHCLEAPVRWHLALECHASLHLALRVAAQDHIKWHAWLHERSLDPLRAIVNTHNANSTTWRSKEN